MSSILPQPTRDPACHSQLWAEPMLLPWQECRLSVPCLHVLTKLAAWTTRSFVWVKCNTTGRRAARSSVQPTSKASGVGTLDIWLVGCNGATVMQRLALEFRSPQYISSLLGVLTLRCLLEKLAYRPNTCDRYGVHLPCKYCLPSS